MIKHKFKAKPQEYDGIKFPSKAEAKRYIELKVLQAKGEITFFLRQVPFHLAGGVKYVCDFMIFWADGSVTVEDVKGMKTTLYIAKKKWWNRLTPLKLSKFKLQYSHIISILRLMLL